MARLNDWWVKDILSVLHNLADMRKRQADFVKAEEYETAATALETGDDELAKKMLRAEIQTWIDFGKSVPINHPHWCCQQEIAWHNRIVYGNMLDSLGN